MQASVIWSVLVFSISRYCAERCPRILFIIIYRPPKYSPAFVEEFTELLSMISSEFDCFAIAGDFNIHIDNVEVKTTTEIITVLNTFDLIQHVHGPTHNRGHTLDLLISRGLNISSIVIKDVALSDHFCIFFDILISVTTESRSVSIRKRCINENTSVLFMKAISLTPSISADSVDLLLDSFNSKVRLGVYLLFLRFYSACPTLNLVRIFSTLMLLLVILTTPTSHCIS